MSYKVPGVGSLIVVCIGLIFGAIPLFMESIYLGIIFTLLLVLSFLFLLYSYCRQCPHVINGTCRHVVIGLLVKKLFKLKEAKPYRLKEIWIGILPIIFLILAMQYWLLQYFIFFIGFWIMIVLGVIIIRLAVCTSCENTHCALCKNKDNCKH